MAISWLGPVVPPPRVGLVDALTPEARAAVEKVLQESGKPLAAVLFELVVRGAG